MRDFSLQRVVDRVGSGIASVDAAPVRKRAVCERALRVGNGGRLRLVQFRRPWQLYGAQGDVGDAQSGVPTEVALHAEVPLNGVRIFEIRIVGGAEVRAAVGGGRDAAAA